MKTRTIWTEKMQFMGEADGNKVAMDAKSPIGSGQGLTPKELLAISISGCTAMDVAALMKKHKQDVKSFEVAADVNYLEGSKPLVFSEVNLTFDLQGDLDREKVLDAVVKSQTLYCGVSAMVAKAVPIHYVVKVNGEEIGRGHAHFQG